MLQHLHIRNFVLVEQAELDVSQGLTVMTGETGAGKSLLLDALGAVLGDKTQPFWVRPGSDKAEVIADFDIQQLPEAQAWLSEQSLDDDNQCLLRRVINADNRSKAYINGTSVTLTQLRQLAQHLIEIHSQHEHHALLTASKQLALIDSWSQNKTLRAEVFTAWQTWHRLDVQQKQLIANEQQRQERLALLSFQAEELTDMQLQQGDYEFLSQEHTRLAYAAEISDNLAQTSQLLTDERIGVINQLTQGLKHLQDTLEHDDSVQDLVNQYQSSIIEIEDIYSQIQQKRHNTTIDDHRLADLEKQLAEQHRLAKKYFVAPESLWLKKEQIMQELDALQQQHQVREHIEFECQQALQVYETVADKLSQQRQQASPQLAQRILLQLQQLGMQHSQLEWRFKRLSQPSSNGLDECQIYFSANPGQALYPMSKVASGGELARISLAIEVCVAEQIALPSLVFDEVDVGVGGGIADSIGEKLANIAQHKQVLCITHQPQVAAWGDTHWHISKHTDGQQTHTQVIALSVAEREQELARMVGTQDNNDATQQHAVQMLSRAAHKKASLNKIK